jgi:hypothetical protein
MGSIFVGVHFQRDICSLSNAYVPFPETGNVKRAEIIIKCKILKMYVHSTLPTLSTLIQNTSKTYLPLRLCWYYWLTRL